MLPLIIDCNNLCHIAKHAMRGLSFEDRDTGVIFGFLNSLLQLYKRFDYDVRFLFAWDSNHSLRVEQYPQYKLKRKATRAEKSEEDRRYDVLARKQMNLLQKHILPTMGFRNVWMFLGYESDDVMALFARKVKEGVLVTTDHDLFQCIDGRVSLFNPITKKLLTSAGFKEEWGIEPYMWASALAIAGCDTDEVPGVEGVGLKTAIKYLKGELRADSVVARRIAKSGELIERNERLVQLPYEREVGAIFFEFEENAEILNDELDMNAAEQLFLEYGFRSFLRDPLRDLWTRLMVF